jgi:hypothetical protein
MGTDARSRESQERKKLGDGEWLIVRFEGERVMSFGWLTQKQVGKGVERLILADSEIWEQKGERFIVVTEEADEQEVTRSRLVDR